MNANYYKSILIWDANGPPPHGDWTIFLWNSFNSPLRDDCVSIPELVESNSDRFRSIYLKWIYDLGEYSFEGKRVVDHLEIEPDFSYWWLTALAQKFNASGKSHINDVIKTLALESVISNFNLSQVTVVSENTGFIRMIEQYCHKRGIELVLDLPPKSSSNKSSVEKIYDILPFWLRSIIYFLWYFFNNLNIITKKKKIIGRPNSRISFFDILVHLNKDSFTTGHFKSNYWTSLLEILANSNVNFFHLFFKQKSIASIKSATKLTERFSKRSGSKHFHVLFEEHLSISIFLKSIKLYIKLLIRSKMLFKAFRDCKPNNFSFNLWLLLRDETRESMIGPSALLNCIRINLFKRVIGSLAPQELGVYVLENQAWEIILIHYWRFFGHGKLVGVPHTTVRYWDLRYFYDLSTYNSKKRNSLPRPDQVAVNGPVARSSYVLGGYPGNELLDVEALRFLHILKSNSTPKRKNIGKKLILVFGDFLNETNQKILSWMSIASRSLPDNYEFLFRPHPAYPFNPKEFPELNLKIAEGGLAELFDDCQIVFASNITSAAVDAYCSGCKVIQMLEGTSFNMSPLRGLKGILYVKSPTELTEAIINMDIQINNQTEVYFNLSLELNLWKTLIFAKQSQ